MKKSIALTSLGVSFLVGLVCLAKKTGFFENDKHLYDEFDSTLQKFLQKANGGINLCKKRKL